MSRRRVDTPVRLIGLGFGFGALEHAVGLVGLWLGWEMYAGYPWWRHAAFTAVDASIAWVAFRRPDRLFVPLLAFLVEQIATNGVDAWQDWRLFHRIGWLDVAVQLLILAAVIVAGPRFNRPYPSQPAPG
jgi:hypothetical protein